MLNSFYDAKFIDKLSQMQSTDRSFRDGAGSSGADTKSRKEREDICLQTYMF
jgi:hypothetical protein